MALRGSCSSRNQIVAGILNLAIRSARNACSASAVERCPGAQHDGGGDVLAEALVGDAEHGRLGHVGVLVDRGLDLGAVHVLAAAQHHVLGPVDDEHEAVLVDAGDVAGVEPAVADRVGGGLRPVQVALDHDRAAHAQLADRVGRRRDVVAELVDQLGVERRHDAARTTPAWRVQLRRVGGDDAARLGEPVAGGRARRSASELVDLLARGRAAAAHRRRPST